MVTGMARRAVPATKSATAGRATGATTAWGEGAVNTGGIAATGALAGVVTGATGATAGAGGVIQKDMVKSEAEEPERSSWGKGHSDGTAKASVDATNAAAGVNPPKAGRGLEGPWTKAGTAGGSPPGKVYPRQ